MNFGIIFNEAIADYHNSEAISSTKLMDLDPCAYHFHGRHISKHIPKPEKKPFAIGNAAHPFILEGNEAYKARVIAHPETYLGRESQKKDAELIEKKWNWNANVCDEWRKPHDEAGRIILSKDEERIVDNMHAAVAGNPDAAAALTGGKAEVTFRKQLSAFAVQCRPDYWQPNGITMLGIFDPVIVDLKTCETIERFKKDFCALRYHFRAEFYRLVVAEVLADMAGVPVSELPYPRFIYVAVEKFPTHRCEVFEADAEANQAGVREVQAAMKTLAQCMKSGEWPRSTPGIQPIGLTSWQQRKSNEMTAEILEGVA